MEFDSVSVQKAGGSVLMTAKEFLALPLDDRLKLIAAGKAEFIKDGKILSTKEIAELLDAAPDSSSNSSNGGSYMMVLNDSETPGKRIPLASGSTSLGKTGMQIGVVARTANGYLLKRIEGMAGLLLNGKSVPADGTLLKNGDIVVVSGTRLQFFA